MVLFVPQHLHRPNSAMLRKIKQPKMGEKEQMYFDEGTELIPKQHWTRIEKRKWTITLMLGTAILYSSRTIMPVCVVAISEELKWQKTQSATVMSSFFWGYMTTQVLGGYVSDRVGGERVVIVVSVLWASITLLTPFLIYLQATYSPDSLHFIIAFRVLLGISQGVHFPSVTSIISKKVPSEERSLAFSLVASGANCGTLLSGSMGSFLTEQYGWQSPFYALGGCGLLWTLMAYKCFLSHGSPASAPVLHAVGTPDYQNSNINGASAVPWCTLFSRLSFWALLVANYCSNNGFYILMSWLPTFFHENFPDATSWVFNVVPWLVIVPCNISGGWIADKMIKAGFNVTSVRKLLATVLFCGTALFLVLISYMDKYATTLLCMTLAIACCGFYSSSLGINPVDLAPSNSGAVFGILNTTSAIPGFVGVYMAGYVLETTKSWSAVFNQAAAMCIFGYIVFLFLGTGRRIV